MPCHLSNDGICHSKHDHRRVLRKRSPRFSLNFRLRSRTATLHFEWRVGLTVHTERSHRFTRPSRLIFQRLSAHYRSRKSGMKIEGDVIGATFARLTL